MDGDDGAGARSDGALDGLRIDLKAIRLTIDENRASFEVQNNLTGGREGHGGENDFVTFGNADGGQGEMKSGGAGIEGDSVAATDIGGKLILEFEGAGTGGKPAALEDLNDRVDFVFFDESAVER